MIFTIKNCKFGFACIAIDEFGRKLCGVELGKTSEIALFNSLNRFVKDKREKKLNTGIFDSNLSQAIEQICRKVLRVIDGEKDGNELFTLDDLSFPYRAATFLQRKIWTILFSLQKGDVLTYKDLADKAELSSAVRAVATSCGKNPLAIVVPCHRIVKSSNQIGKYRWGDDLKKELLRREGSYGFVNLLV